jgi:prenyl protein peptidase
VFAVALYARVSNPRCLGTDGVAAALGLRLDGSVKAAAAGAACVAVLYLGTLAERLVLGAFALPEFDAIAWRNLVVGPLTEELCFRACVLPLLIEAGITRWRAVRAAPLVFGLAHVHHGRRRVVDDGVPLSHAVIETTVQFAYTSLFGAFASYAFCRTHRLSAPVAAHVLCNYLGLPEFACLRPGPLYDYRLAFVALHIAGIFLFFTRSGWLLASSESVLWA